MLDQTQINAFWRDGYLFPLRVMTETQALSHRRQLEAIEARWLSADLPHPLLQYKRVNAHCVMPFAAHLAMNSAVLDAVECILGPDILVWSVEFLIKEPGTSHIVSMHQDLTYWGFGDTSDQVTAWLALSPATPESGCMEFVRGSHNNPILPHKDTFSTSNLLSRGQEIAVDIAPADRTAIPLRAGEMSLHHGLTIHGSGPNRSTDRRIGFAVRYINPNVRQRVAERDYAMLARGVDRSGHFINYAPPTEPFAAASLALYDEIRADQAKALAEGARNVALYQ